MSGEAAGTRSDEALVHATLAHRDERAFRELYRRHTPLLYRMAYRLADGDPDLAQDAVHDTWLRAVGTLHGFAWRSTLSTWLTSILVNRMREVWRTRERRPTVPLVPAHELSRPAPLHAERLDLERAIAALPAGYRTVFLLHDVEGYSHEQTAEMLGVEVGTSKSQLARARRSLRRLLEPEETLS